VPATLPIDAKLPELAAALNAYPAAILVAAPGAGKTTRVPLALLDSPWLEGRKIVMLEPRRLAARAAASRMASTLGENAGETVGYSVRLERKVSAKTRIEVVTEGLLTRRMQNDPALDDTGLLIFDEFHERSLDGDLGLALALDIQHGLRPDLKLLVMSATLDEMRLGRHLGGAPVVTAPGRLFPIETRHLDRPDPRGLPRDMARAIRTALGETKGGMIVFLPGEREIRRTEEALSEAGLPANAKIMPLYGAMPLAQQDEAIRPSADGLRKIVLATTIAETSLTIDGIDTVIDSGLKRVPHFDPASGMTALETVRVSQASADQRRGRAGRLGPGISYRLWPEAETRALKAHDTPEILAADLAPLALDLAQWGVASPSALRFLDPPPEAAYAQARDLLIDLDALDSNGALTPMGKAMAKLPLHPRLAHMVVRGKELGALRLAADLAALLSDRDIGRREQGADIALRLDALRRGGGAAERIKAQARQIASLIGGGNDGEVSPGVLVALAFPDRIASGRGGNGRFRLSGGGGAFLDQHDPLAREDFLAVATTDGASGDQRIYLAAQLSRAEIEEHFVSHMKAHDELRWESREGQVVARRQRRLGSLVLDDKPLTKPDAASIQAAMVEGLRETGLAALPWTDTANNLRARVRFAARTMTEEAWPDFSDTALLATLDEWLGPYLAGMTRLSHLARLDLVQILSDRIPHDLRLRLDRIAPQRVAIPSGAHIAIDYESDGDPVLRARLQEMFGLHDTPRIAEGRAKLRIELLSPARRPLAVTQDLPSFWVNAYPQVRAEMRGRYPKHKWPENPLVAEAVKPNKMR
jgi:ATP-dependent helicase HrpB